MTSGPVLEYGAKARPPGRRTAVVAFVLSLLSTPPVMVWVVRPTADVIDDWMHEGLLHLLLYAMVCTPGLVAAGMGAASQQGGRRWFGAAAMVVGVLATLANGILLTLALAA